MSEFGHAKYRAAYDQRRPPWSWPLLRDWLKHCAETWPPGFDITKLTRTRRPR